MATLTTGGCDPHLDSITTAVVDSAGRCLQTLTVANSPDGWDQILGLCREHHVELVGVEAASGYGRKLSETLTSSGIRVKEIPTRLTSRTRRTDGAGKTDPGDARTIARATSRNEGYEWNPDLLDEAVRVLCHRRNHLVRAQTGDVNEMRALIAEIDPPRASQMRRIRSRKQLLELANIEYPGDVYVQTVVQTIRQIAAGCAQRQQLIKNLEAEMAQLLPPAGQELIHQITGCGLISAATLIAELAGVRHQTHAKMAAWAGTAPLDASSGRQQRHRLNRRGNRQANRAIHTIITTQLQHNGPARTYLDKRLSEGKTQNEAIRALKRHLTRRIWKILNNN